MSMEPIYKSTQEGELPELASLLQDKKSQAQIQKQLRQTLAMLGGALVGEDDLKFEGSTFIIPENMKNVDKAIEFLKLWKKQQEEVHTFSRVFSYRPFDGAHAVKQVLIKVFGTRGMGKSWTDMMGQKHPPQQLTVPIGPGEVDSVPWGLMEMPLFEGTLNLGQTKNAEFGVLFLMTIEAPRKFERHVNGFFDLIQRELQAHSIYKGKAFNGADTPDFLDLTVDPNKVVYSMEVQRQLSANIWSMIRHSDVNREANLPEKRAVLLEGDYGTGKTLAGGLTAQIAVDNGWTFIKCRPGKDSWQQVMSTARLYPPCVVFFEDIDTVASMQDKDTISELLDAFDGIDTKGAQLLAVLTTNHAEQIHKGMIRPGRLDSVIKFEHLDTQGVEHLIKAAIPAGMLTGDIEWDNVTTAMDGFLPAFVKETADRTIRYAIDREQGMPTSITEDDLVEAANGMRHHLDLMDSAKEVAEPEPLTEAFKVAIIHAMEGTKVTAPGEREAEFELHHPDKESVATRRNSKR